MQICLLILFFFLNLTLGGQYERRLLKTLFVKQQHNPFERPAKSDSASVSVDLRFSLLNLIEFNTQNKILTASFWMTQSWNDYSMTWKSKDYGNISELRVPSKNIWLPDIVLYNSIDSNDDNDMKRNVVISHDGKVLYVSPRIYKSICSSNTNSFSVFKFGSWTFDKTGINLTTTTNDQIDTSSYVNNDEWDLINSSALHNEVKYECCQEIYQSIVLTIEIRRKFNNLSTGAPMPGQVLDIKAKLGDMIKKGDTVAVLSAMKMETVVKSSGEGKVKQVLVKIGQQIQGDDLIIELE
ncbi:unnamed protein product [Rotaria magnacalcarata]|uniref:Lipoyl-binding domain-containing protein n=1 Tax=Rotaria magnacalcarata TaxID=392030 RepID=A0A816SPP6_9BILA|nr:unnamed protein product [Rotaria magnacalcarata]